MSRSVQTTVRRSRSKHSDRAGTPTVHVFYTPGATPPRRAFEDATLTIGRADSASIALVDDTLVSRVHATISRTPLEIVDSSTNGTFVNGRRVKEAPLADGDVIRIGDSLLLLRVVPADFAEEPEAHGILGDAPVMHELRRTLRLVGPTGATVLVTGESGTGKELVARALHAAYRPTGPFIAVNCGAIPEALAESQLFGHVAGAFTGARADHPGFFRAASGGVIFLDEVGELTSALQAKLLRAVEERAVVPVGAVSPAKFDARIVAATNRTLANEVRAGRFRGDLFARLGEIEVHLPPLRARIEDVVSLAQHSLGEGAPPLSADLVEALLLHDWPFNVRELFKIATELRVRGQGAKSLELALVAERLRRATPPSREAPSPEDAKEDDRERPIPTHAELCALLREHEGRVADVARATGRSRKQVYRWIEAHGLDLETFR